MTQPTLGETKTILKYAYFPTMGLITGKTGGHETTEFIWLKKYKEIWEFNFYTDYDSWGPGGPAWNLIERKPLEKT